MRLATQILAISVLVACSSTGGQARPQECAPTTDKLSTRSVVAHAGDYQLRLVATSGAKTGSAVEGTLKLQPQSESLRYRTRPGGARDTAVAHPLYGSADLDLSAVDAVSVGSTTSMNPMQPGVLVVEHHKVTGQAAAVEITIRLGSEANRQGLQHRVDGGYMALRVREASPKRLAGTWSSGVTMERAAGYFCAVRKDRR